MGGDADATILYVGIVEHGWTVTDLANYAGVDFRKSEDEIRAFFHATYMYRAERKRKE